MAIHDSRTTKYCYDGGQVIAEYDGNDTLLRKFIYGPGIDEPIRMIDVADSNAVYYYHLDGLGSVVALSNNSGEVVESYSYDVFGESNTTSSVGNPYMFTGRRFDPETALYYYRARYYNPEIGRFLQPDPIGYTAGLNLYTYCGNNPINWIDPWGLFFERVWSDPKGRGGHSNNAINYKQFIVHSHGKTLRELQNEVNTGRQMSESSAPGPLYDYRYVVDPANPNQIIDMRHFLVVGPKGEIVGLAIEIAQLRGDYPSAFDAQDFLSNTLGKDFYKNYYKKYPHLPLNVLLNEYFRNRQKKGCG